MDPLLLQSLNLTQLPEAASWVDEAGVLHQLWVSGSFDVVSNFSFAVDDLISMQLPSPTDFRPATAAFDFVSGHQSPHPIHPIRPSRLSPPIPSLAATVAFRHSPQFPPPSNMRNGRAWRRQRTGKPLPSIGFSGKRCVSSGMTLSDSGAVKSQVRNQAAR
ncbi:hypothetical protein Droror1_Dr00004127 [Drosera rotundifolia]